MTHALRVLTSRRRAAGWIATVLCAGLIVSAERVATQAAQEQPGGNARAAWRPTLPSWNDGEVHVLPVRGNIYMIVGAGGNITLQVGPDGLLLVDSGLASHSDKVLAAIHTVSDAPIRYIVNTDHRREHVEGNAAIAAKGETIPFRLLDSVGGIRRGGGSGPAGIFNTDRASVISFLKVFERMSAPSGQVAPTPEEAWPDNTYSTAQKKLTLNEEAIRIIHQPGPTDGNSIVMFRRADVISVGDLVDLTGFPRIDVAAGGNIDDVIDSLNDILDLTVPDRRSEQGTLVIPGHGRLADIAEVTYYRDMAFIIRDRIQHMLKRGMTLEQVKAAAPTRDYDPRYGKATGDWTTDMFVEAVYRSLSK